MHDLHDQKSLHQRSFQSSYDGVSSWINPSHLVRHTIQATTTFRTYSTSCIFSLKRILPEDGIAETFCSRILLEGRHQHRLLQARQELLQLSDNGKPVNQREAQKSSKWLTDHSQSSS